MAENSDVALTPKELANRWKVSVKTLAYWRTIGKGPRFFYADPKGKNSPRYSLDEVIACEKSLQTHS